jgi:hypothetical protein
MSKVVSQTGFVADVASIVHACRSKDHELASRAYSGEQVPEDIAICSSIM